jgi:hypothetical protein
MKEWHEVNLTRIIKVKLTLFNEFAVYPRKEKTGRAVKRTL